MTHDITYDELLRNRKKMENLILNDKVVAKAIVERMKKCSNAGTYEKLGEILGGITQSAISQAISKGSLPNHWFEIMENKFGVTRDELCRKLDLIEAGVGFNVAAPTVADPGYHTDQDKRRAEREVAGDSRQRRAQLVARFGLVFDFVEEVYGENQVAVEDFFDRLKQLLMHEPDYRAWLYEKREEMAGALKKRAGGGGVDTPPDTLSAVGDGK